MARMARLYLPGCPQHVIQRGNNRTSCFIQERDYLRYLHYLEKAAHTFDVAVHAFVMMGNHVHLLITPEDAKGCGRMMQSLGRSYVRYFNERYQRSGTLWEGRYKSTLVDSDAYFFTVCRYIELNPVRANIVEHPCHYPWSSYHSHALGTPSTLLTMHPLYLGLGHNQEQRQRSYQSFFDQPLAQDLLAQLREATNHAWVFGSDSFKAGIESEVNRRAVSSGWGGRRCRASRFTKQDS